MLPEASSSRVARSAGMSASSAAIAPLRMPTSRLALRPWLGSTTSPPLTTRSNLPPSGVVCCAEGVVLAAASANRELPPARRLRLFTSASGLI
jgi:hypothetical protein